MLGPAGQTRIDISARSRTSTASTSHHQEFWPCNVVPASAIVSPGVTQRTLSPGENSSNSPRLNGDKSDSSLLPLTTSDTSQALLSDTRSIVAEGRKPA